MSIFKILTNKFISQYKRSCLQIIQDEESDIQYEKDLILALRIIEEFELSILPMQGIYYEYLIIYNITFYQFIYF